MSIYGNRKELAELLGVQPPNINRHKKNGILDDCMSHDGKKYHLEKSVEAITKSKTKETHNSKIKTSEPKAKKESSNKLNQNIPKTAKDKNLDSSENIEELNTLLDGAINSYQKVTMTKEFWLGKINEQKFKKEEGELMSVSEVKEVLDKVLTPFNRHYDEMPIIIRSHIPDVSDEVVEWIKKYNEENKLEFSKITV